MSMSERRLYDLVKRQIRTPDRGFWTHEHHLLKITWFAPAECANTLRTIRDFIRGLLDCGVVASETRIWSESPAPSGCQ
jgi:hypothetical protein